LQSVIHVCNAKSDHNKDGKISCGKEAKLLRQLIFADFAHTGYFNYFYIKTAYNQLKINEI